jgi:hypothetical protein
VSHHPDTLYREISWIAYHFHWDLDGLLDLEHASRRRYVGDIEELNAALGRA